MRSNEPEVRISRGLDRTESRCFGFQSGWCDHLDATTYLLTYTPPPQADEPRQDSPNQIRSPPLVHDLSNDQEVDRAFEALYLQQMTAEFADDLDALRRADDFTEESLPILLTALKQGTDLFSLDEKRAVVAATNRKKT